MEFNTSYYFGFICKTIYQHLKCFYSAVSVISVSLYFYEKGKKQHRYKYIKNKVLFIC